MLRTPAYVEQLGVLGWLDVRLPAALHLGWLGVAAGLLVAGARGAAGAALALLAVAGAVAVVPALLEAGRINDLGFIWQGRYTLPLAAGVPVLAAALVAERWGDGRAGRRAVGRGRGAAGRAQVVALVVRLRRWTVGVEAAHAGRPGRGRRPCRRR